MCRLVIMCLGLALLCGTNGNVISADKTVVEGVGDNLAKAKDCISKCIPICRQTAKTNHLSCCDCTSFCEKSCDRSTRTLLHRASEGTETPSSPGTPCAKGNCEFPDFTMRNLLALSSPCRTKKRSSRSPMLKEAAVVARSVGMDLGTLDTRASHEQSASSESAGIGRQVIAHLESIVLGEDFVTAQVSWDHTPGSSRLPRGGSWYLVSWEPAGGGVTGNLLTNTTSASLTLWPDTVYHVQVSSPSAKGSSKYLEVDTHAPPSTPRQFTHEFTYGFALSRVEEIGGVLVALMLFLTVLLASVVRCANKRKPSSEIVNHQKGYDQFKLYPPPVTLCHPGEMCPPSQELPI